MCMIFFWCDTIASFSFFVDYVHPRLKKWYHNCLERVRGYLETIIDFDKLISPQSLFLHFLGPKRSSHVQKNIEVVKKSKFTDFVRIM